MPASKKRHYARYTIAAVKLLGTLVALERKTRRMTSQELSSRLGVDRGTVRRLEAGDPKVELGTAFEACAILGVSLFDEDERNLTVRLDQATRQVALLPMRSRAARVSISDDF